MHIVLVGAHPDDVEGSAGGTAALFHQRGDTLKFISITDGSRGHFHHDYVQDPGSLAQRRMAEAQTAAAVVGAEFHCMGIPDGEVYVNQAVTEEMIRLLRYTGLEGVGPDLVILNRPNDYHRDHRYGAQIVLDAAYLLTVPTICPEVRHLDRMPIFAYWQDDFTEGGTFRADVVVDIAHVLHSKTRMTAAHASQYFEWLAYNDGELENVPDTDEKRFIWRKNAVVKRAKELGKRFSGDADKAVEAFQISEYGRQPTDAEKKTLFPT